MKPFHFYLSAPCWKDTKSLIYKRQGRLQDISQRGGGGDFFQELWTTLKKKVSTLKKKVSTLKKQGTKFKKKEQNSRKKVQNSQSFRLRGRRKLLSCPPPLWPPLMTIQPVFLQDDGQRGSKKRLRYLTLVVFYPNTIRVKQNKQL